MDVYGEELDNGNRSEIYGGFVKDEGCGASATLGSESGSRSAQYVGHPA